MIDLTNAASLTLWYITVLFVNVVVSDESEDGRKLCNINVDTVFLHFRLSWSEVEQKLLSELRALRTL